MKIIFDSKFLNNLFLPKNLPWVLYVLGWLMFSLAGLTFGLVNFLIVAGVGLCLGGAIYAIAKFG